MKKSILFLSTILGLATYAQHSCCKQAIGDKMSTFASTADFKTAHESPEEYTHTNALGKMIEFKTADSQSGKAYYIPAKAKSNKVLFVFHEWWGLNDHIKKEADDLYASLGENVAIYAFDLYDGAVATTPDDAGKLMTNLKPERALNIIKGGIAQLAPKVEIATIGWCMGGSYSFQAAVECGTQVKACVMYYGFPETNEARLKALQTDIFYIQALQDAFITQETVSTFEKSLQENHKKITIKAYDAVHAFANPSNPKHNSQFTNEAYALSLSYLKKGLKIK